MFEVQTRELISGSVIALATRGWSVDTNTPTASITSKPEARTWNPRATFRLASDDRAARLDCRLDGGAWSLCAEALEYLWLADGPHRFDVRAEDAVGNRQDPPATWTWTVDTQPAPAGKKPSAPPCACASRRRDGAPLLAGER